MSFEGVFKNWLKVQDPEERKELAGGSLEQQQQTVHPGGETGRGRDESEIHHDAFGKPSKSVCVKSAVNTSSKQAGRKAQSTAHLSVQISHPLKDGENRKAGVSVKQLHHKEKTKDLLGETTEINEHSIASVVDYGHMKQNMPAEGQDHQQCHTHSPLTDLGEVTPTTFPAGAEVLRVDPAPSPEHDLPMEPDSTSECLSLNKSMKSTKKCEISLLKAYHRREDSPCSTGYTGESSTGVQTSAATAHMEEGQAECDSTCMFLASPNAISPASQGEIEERVCPFLTDHEDGASPAHCVCQCRSLPTPANLLPRDHVPTITTATSASPPSLTSPHLTVKIISSKSDNSCLEIKSKPPLIGPQSHYECKATSDLELFATKLNLKRKKIEDKQQSETMVATLQHKELRKQYCTEYAENDSASRANASDVKKGSSELKTQLSLSELSTDKAGAQRHERNSDPVELDVSAKCDPKQNEVCDFAKHIDWDTAVAETLESSTSVRGYDGESKPGIILKIRAKAVVPCLERNLELKSTKSDHSLKRKGENVGSPEILSRLRKRVKSEASASETLTVLSEQEGSEQHTEHCKERSKRLKSGTGSACSCRSLSSSKHKRRNTVQVDGELKAYIRHLSARDSRFVEATTRLSRLQTLTYRLVCSLFPHLRQQLNHMAPESHHFTEIVDDIIGSLERSESEEILKELEHLCEGFENLTVEEADLVPVYSPQVVLCRDPLHMLEDFQHKVCNLLQLLLPDLTVSLSDCCLHPPGQLEVVLKQVLMANKIKDKSSRKFRVMSL